MEYDELVIQLSKLSKNTFDCPDPEKKMNLPDDKYSKSLMVPQI